MIIKLPEHLTEKTTNEFKHKLDAGLASKYLNILLDFSDVREMDSVALETLLQYMNQVAQHDGTIRVSGMSPEAAIFLEFTRMDSVFAMFQDRPVFAPALTVSDFANSTVQTVRSGMQPSAA
jgi:anti-anti-sigma factor